MASQTGLTQEHPSRSARAMAALYDEVVRRGHLMRFLAPHHGAPIAEIVERERAGSVLRVQAPAGPGGYFLRWPKDGLQSHPGFVAVADSPVMRRVCRKLGIRNAVVSPLCEGGLFVRSGRMLLLSSASRAQRRLLRRHYDVTVIPHRSHIDLDCALVHTRAGKPLLLAGERYYESCTEAIRSVAASSGAIVHVVPWKESERRVLNLVLLPPGDVLIPAGCPSTRGVLEKHLGRDHVVPVRIDGDFNYNGGYGGLGCMSSVLDADHAEAVTRPAYRARRAPSAGGSIAGDARS